VQFEEEEVASRGYKELHIESSEEEYLREFLTPFDQERIVKQLPSPVIK